VLTTLQSRQAGASTIQKASAREMLQQEQVVSVRLLLLHVLVSTIRCRRVATRLLHPPPTITSKSSLIQPFSHHHPLSRTPIYFRSPSQTVLQRRQLTSNHTAHEDQPELPNMSAPNTSAPIVSGPTTPARTMPVPIVAAPAASAPKASGKWQNELFGGSNFETYVRNPNPLQHSTSC